MKNGAVQMQTGLSLEGFLHQLPQEHSSLHLVTHVHTDIKGILKRTLAEATFFLTCLFIQQAFIGLLDM